MKLHLNPYIPNKNYLVIRRFKLRVKLHINSYIPNKSFLVIRRFILRVKLHLNPYILTFPQMRLLFFQRSATHLLRLRGFVEVADKDHHHKFTMLT